MTQFVLVLLLLLPLPSLACDVEVAFSPDRGAGELVVRTIESARQTVRIAAYSFSSKPIAEALLADARRGVDVKVIVDKSQATARYTAATFLANAGVPVRVDFRYSIMHSKYMVIDGRTVETGSFNFTRRAGDRNAENVIVVRDASIAEVYGVNWSDLWEESQPMASHY